MRIFFEVNRNRSDTSVELRNAELFNCYLKQINSKYDEFNFSQFVMQEYKEYAMDETVINSLLALSKCPELKELLAQHQARYSTK